MTSLIIFLLSFGYLVGGELPPEQAADTQGTEEVAREQTPDGDFVVITDIGGA